MKEKFPIGHVYGLPTESQDKEKQPMADRTLVDKPHACVYGPPPVYNRAEIYEKQPIAERKLEDEPLACVYGPPPVYNNTNNYANPKKSKLKALLSKLLRK